MRQTRDTANWPKVIIRLDPEVFASLTSQAKHLGTSKTGHATMLLTDGIRSQAGDISPNHASGSALDVHEMADFWAEPDAGE